MTTEPEVSLPTSCSAHGRLQRECCDVTPLPYDGNPQRHTWLHPHFMSLFTIRGCVMNKSQSQRNVEIIRQRQGGKRITDLATNTSATPDGASAARFRVSNEHRGSPENEPPTRQNPETTVGILLAWPWFVSVQEQQLLPQAKIVCDQQRLWSDSRSNRPQQTAKH